MNEEQRILYYKEQIEQKLRNYTFETETLKEVQNCLNITNNRKLLRSLRVLNEQLNRQIDEQTMDSE